MQRQGAAVSEIEVSAKACGCQNCRRAYDPVAVDAVGMRDAILTALGYSTEGRRDRRPS